MTSSTYPIPTNPFATVASGTDILQSDLTITRAMVSPGGGALLRVYFAFTLAATGAVTIFNNASSKGTLNADNSSAILTNGYYRFDLDIEEGDILNFQATENITAVLFFRAHVTQFGA